MSPYIFFQALKRPGQREKFKKNDLRRELYVHADVLWNLPEAPIVKQSLFSRIKNRVFVVARRRL